MAGRAPLTPPPPSIIMADMADILARNRRGMATTTVDIMTAGSLPARPLSAAS